MVRQLKSGTGLTLKEAEDRYVSVWQEFEAIKQNYSGLFGIFRRIIRPIDKGRLVACIETLSLLSAEDPVQKQRINLIQNIEETLHYRVRELNVQVFEYLGSFRDSGNERLGIRPKIYPLLLEKLR